MNPFKKKRGGKKADRPVTPEDLGYALMIFAKDIQKESHPEFMAAQTALMCLAFCLVEGQASRFIEAILPFVNERAARAHEFAASKTDSAN